MRKTTFRLGLTLMFALAVIFSSAVQAVRADPTTKVTVSRAYLFPEADLMTLGTDVLMGFNATVDGAPATNDECTLTTTWTWTITVTGPAGSMVTGTTSYDGASGSIGFTPDVAGIYNISATATVDYVTSCGGHFSATSTDADGVSVLDCCPPDPLPAGALVTAQVRAASGPRTVSKLSIKHAAHGKRQTSMLCPYV